MKIKYFIGMMSLLALTSVATTSCSDDVDSATPNTAALVTSVTTGDATVSAVGADIKGIVTDLSSQSASSYAVGIKYSTSEADVKNGTATTATLASDGSFTSSITGLSRNTQYYYITYVTLQNTVTYYGSVKNFFTSNAQVNTDDASGVTSAAATIGGKLSNVANLPTNATLTCGVKLSESADNVTDGLELGYNDAASVVSGSAYAIQKLGLLPNTVYYYTAFMKLNNGYIYGETKNFKTSAYETELVDMGLSVYWAKTNVGAASESDLGGLYGYGDTTGLKQTMILKDYASGDISGTSSDICSKISDCRMPTFNEVRELVNNCTISEETVNNVACYRVKGPSGNSILIPLAGYRDGNTIKSEGSAAYLWTGSANANSSDHAATLNLHDGKAAFGNGVRYQGLSVRPVKRVHILFDNSKLVETENSGDLRFELYNEWGKTKDATGLNANAFGFNKKMYVNFTVSGLGQSCTPFDAKLGFANRSWGVQNWGDGKGTVQITGDGTYTVSMDASAPVTDYIVFVIDLKGQGALLNKVHGYINSIIVDADNTNSYYASTNDYINQSKILKGELEASSGNYRIELYNQWGGTAKDPVLDFSKCIFSQRIAVEFTLSGLNKLANSYDGFLCFADAGWAVQNWGYIANGGVKVTGDGDYTVYLDATQTTTATPPVVIVQINGLAKDVDVSKITAIVKGIYWK